MLPNIRGALLILLIVTATVLLSMSIAAAHQPRGTLWDLVEYEDSGKYDPAANTFGDTFLQVSFRSRDSRAYMVVRFPECGMDPKVKGKPVSNLDELINNPDASPNEVSEWTEPEPRYVICPTQSDNVIQYNYSGDFVFNVDFRGNISENVRVDITGYIYDASAEAYKWKEEKLSDEEIGSRISAMKKPDEVITLSFYYRLDGDKLTFVRGDFPEIFGKGQSDENDGFSSGDYDKNAADLPVVVEHYRYDLQIPDNTQNDGGARHRDSLDDIYREGTTPAGNYFCFRDPFKTDRRSHQDGTRSTRATTHTITGKLSVKWASDHSLHPAFGWWAEAWTNDGGWTKLAEDWVQSDGRYTLRVDSGKGYDGSHLQVFFRAYNVYFKPSDRNDDPYSWKNPAKTNISSNHDEGHRFADCDGGDANGLGELHYAAMLMWSRLYWDAGVNPVRTDPIIFYYPNTWYDCGDGSGVPWSCSSRSDPKIWLTATHGMDGTVVTHEMAHQLNNEYWSNKSPANSGGSHNINNCYPTRLGMALKEGFANFIPAWVGYSGRNVAEGGFNTDLFEMTGSFDPEERTAPPNCTNGWENEVWVMRTLWDLHDTRADGDDILWFNHLGAVINLYLAEEPANDGDAMDMRDLETVYSNAASSGHQSIITDIFDQNRQ